MSLGHNLKHLMDLTSASYGAIADHCGTDPQAIQQLVKRKSNKSSYASGIASYFKVPLELLLNGNEAKIDQFLSERARHGESPTYGIGASEHSALLQTLPYLPSVPVTKCLITGQGEYCSMEILYSGGHISWPLSGAYALKVQGDHLAPRVRHGEYMLVDPTQPFSSGDEIVAEMKTGERVFVGVFLYKRDGVAYFDDLNQSGRKISISEADILHTHLIAGYAKSSLHRF